MKKQLPAFLSGVFVTTMLLGLETAALAVSGTVAFSKINLEVNGTQVAKAGDNYTLDSGGQAPYSITYTDETGGGTTYLPVRKIGELLGAKIGWNAKTGSVTVGETTPTKTPDKPAADYSTWTAEEEKAYQEWKALWKVELSEVGGHQDYVNLSCGKENKEKVKNICAINDNPTIQKMNARIDIELYKTYRAGPSFYILYKIDENIDGNIKTGWTDICYKDLKVSNGYSKSLILKELS